MCIGASDINSSLTQFHPTLFRHYCRREGSTSLHLSQKNAGSCSKGIVGDPWPHVAICRIFNFDTHPPSTYGTAYRDSVFMSLSDAYVYWCRIS